MRAQRRPAPDPRRPDPPRARAGPRRPAPPRPRSAPPLFRWRPRATGLNPVSASVPAWRPPLGCLGWCSFSRRPSASVGGARSGWGGTTGLGLGALVHPGPDRKALVVAGPGTRAGALSDPRHAGLAPLRSRVRVWRGLGTERSHVLGRWSRDWTSTRKFAGFAASVMPAFALVAGGLGARPPRGLCSQACLRAPRLTAGKPEVRAETAAFFSPHPDFKMTAFPPSHSFVTEYF
ncbi:unnamed protein product [Rangifer tarandus platyrhynchus]|uniref:Uncharacterized protein n=2 Tax=Rangifer tarandus platyrhynchus TaxID=3082113 RepID=A0ABN8Z601_RANTA|nr:unnamed protein product [Rangifer tarandus platyrhynchus]CAI9703790.1 unnamed protein product [Rangifer tarandus platyrhynchus]